MKNSVKGLIALAVVLLISVLISQQTQQMQPATARLLAYTTTSTRTTNVNNLCGANLDRTTLVNQADVAAATQARTAVSAELGIDGNQIFNYALNGNVSLAIEKVTAGAQKLGMYVGAFAVGFVIFLIIWPFLCCCCTCPSCCPSKCCQKAESEQYSKCELYWPTVTLILALLLTIGASIYGFTKVSTFGPAISNLGCSFAIFTDDLLNGNVTSSGTSFFTGLNTLNTQIGNLNGNLSSINTNFGDFRGTGAGSDSDTALTNINAIASSVQQIPDTASPYKLLLTYNTPIDTAGNTGTMDSNFIAVLGDYSNSSSLVGALYALVTGIATQITNLRSNATSFNTDFGSVNGQVNSIQSSITSIVDSIVKIDNSLESPLKLTQTAGNNGNMGLQAFYGVFIGFGFFALLGALLTTCCDKYGCRHLMYFSCVFLFIVGLIGFLLVTFISVLIPAATWGCSFMDVTLASSTGFNANLQTALGATTASQLQVCMPFGHGRIVDSITSGSSMNALNNLTSIINIMGAWNNTQSQSYISGNLTSFMNTVGTWCRGQVPDVNSTQFAILQNLANPSYSGWTSCNAAFSADSWVPSNSQNSTYTTIPCQVSSGNVGDTTTCTATLANNGANTCAGCMDSTKLQTIITTANINAQLNAKYSASCTFNTAMTNVWTKYYNIKKTALGPTASAGSGSGVLRRASDAQTSIRSTATPGLFYSMNLLDARLTTIQNSMSIISALIDPTTGLVAGLNCLLFGEDFQRIQNVMCGSMYYNMYTMRMALGLSCYGVLFAMCCIVCTGVRHYKHSQRKTKVGDAFFKEGRDETSGAHLRGKD